jgi:prepilin-type N-terminal cleavage/methylation domain-containing protein
MNLRKNTSGFTLIEIIIGMTIFSIGLTGIYALLETTISNASYSRDEIVAA